MEPASIRFNNPGAMWGKGNALATKWGSTASPILNDSLGQGNNIAVFPDKIHGAAAQFDLWHTSPHYHNQELQVAIKTWSGSNSWQQYMNFLIARVKGLTATTIINDAFLSSHSGIEFVKAQAWHEAGERYPMSDDEWKQAQGMVFKNTDPVVASMPTIIIGSTGVNVSKLQRVLGCKDTGIYLAGSETEYALRLYQIRHGLKADGECGQLTWEKLNSKTNW